MTHDACSPHDDDRSLGSTNLLSFSEVSMLLRDRSALVTRSLVALLLTGCMCTANEPTVRNRSVGEPCLDATQCRSGLACHAGLCAPMRSSTAGSGCVLTLDCAEGLYCGASRTCETSGEGVEGTDCNTAADCESGLVCSLEGFGGRCRAPGTRDLHQICESQVDCLAGLTCAVRAGGSTACESAMAQPIVGEAGGFDGGVPPVPPVLGTWTGETCEMDDGPARAYFEIPRHDGTDHDFFRLPFPSDVRRTATGLDLEGFPTPGTALPIDILGRYVTASEDDLDGWATNPSAVIRMSRPYDGDSVNGHIHFVDITPGSPSYAQERGLAWLTSYGRITKYVCEDWIGIRGAHGDPLRPGNTYAIYLTTGIRDTSGNVFGRDADFDTVMRDTAPTATEDMAAWTSQAPFRTFLTEQMIDPSTILDAAVFTTQHANDMVPALRAAEHAAPLPVLSDAVICSATAVSPCDDGTERRRCVAADPDFTEIHAHLSLPIFQEGTAPYEAPEDGGGISLSATGTVAVVRTEEVCVSITVPTAPPPAGGYPVLVAAHGTGGSFTDHIRVGLAHDVATAAVPAVTIGLDLPQHGARRGGSTRSPDRLVYNFLNPRAARDVFLQGAADIMGVVRFVDETTLDAATSPTGAAIPLDTTHVVLFGHSQGAQHAGLLAAYETSLSAIVFSEVGGDLTQSLLHKTQPFDIAASVPLALLDFDGAGHLATGNFHPALSLFQGFFERVDPVNFGRLLAREPAMGDTGREIFATYGLDDHFTPEETLQAFMQSAGFPIVQPVLREFGATSVPAPLSGNVTVNGVMRTFGARQYMAPAGIDGHFVSTESAEGRADVLHFLDGAFAGTTPQIGE
jgi:hypothetical protein